MKTFLIAATAFASAIVATPALSAITSFASFTPVAAGTGSAALRNVKLLRSGSGAATMYTLGTQSRASTGNANFGAVATKFSFLSPYLSEVFVGPEIGRAHV